MRKRPGVPVYEPDLYSRSAILDTYTHYQRLRELGPVVWLAHQSVYALPRYSECKQVLRDDETFRSGQGVALNPIVNRLSRGTILNSDGDDHTRRRSLLSPHLTRRALGAMAGDIDAQAHAVVEAATARGDIDGVDLATALPMSVVPDLIGWPERGREHLLRWAAATFDSLGPINRQWVRSAPSSLQMLAFARRTATDRAITAGGAAHDILRAADRGELPRSQCPALMIDYLAPSLDTTISAISSALYLFATHPQQWGQLKADPSLIPNAVNEVVRFHSPIRAFTRLAAAPARVGETAIEAGARVVVLYGSANRDPLEWYAPDTFDIRRDAARQLGFGHGSHGCAGQGLARLEIQAILRALVEHVERLEVTGTPQWALNNVIHRYAHLPLRLIPAGKVPRR